MSAVVSQLTNLPSCGQRRTWFDSGLGRLIQYIHTPRTVVRSAGWLYTQADSTGGRAYTDSGVQPVESGALGLAWYDSSSLTSVVLPLLAARCSGVLACWSAALTAALVINNISATCTHNNKAGVDSRFHPRPSAAPWWVQWCVGLLCWQRHWPLTTSQPPVHTTTRQV